MDTLFGGIAAPHRIVGFHVELAQAVERDDVELVHRLVVLGRVAGAHNDPVLGHLMAPERLELQELQHAGVQRLAHAVDLVQEQDAAPLAGRLHVVVNGAHDLAHRVFRGVVLVTFEIPLHDLRQAQGALAGMVRHRVRHYADAKLLCDLLDDGRFADAWRAHHEHGPLLHRRNNVHAGVIAAHVRTHRILDLLLCRCDIHGFLRFPLP